MTISGRKKPQKDNPYVRPYARTEQRTYVQVYTTSYLSAFIILIGLEKPGEQGQQVLITLSEGLTEAARLSQARVC